MTKKYWVYFFVSIFYISASAATKCPQVKALENFNFARVSEGIWYENARYDYNVEISTSCVVVRAYPRDYGFMGESINIPYESPEHLRGDCKIVDDSGKGICNFIMSSGGDPKRIQHLPHLKFIYDDGETVISYACVEDKKSQTADEFSWIFSRKPVLSDEDKERISEIVKTLNPLDINKFLWIKQDVCPK